MFDPHDPTYAKDPWATFERLRAECPVSHSDRYDGGFWAVARYDDVKAISLDTDTYSAAGDLLVPSAGMGWPLLPAQCDPPLTAEYRRVLNHIFNVRAVKELEPLVRAWTTEAIDAFADRGSCDWVRDLAYPVPGKVTAHLVGWPVDGWKALMDSIKQFTTRGPDEPERAAGAAGVQELRERVIANVEQRRADPTHDLASQLLRSEVEGRALTTDEIVALMMMVIFGGVDTTVAAIGNMLHRLDVDRDLRRQLIDEPSLIPAAVDELLRLEPPIQGFARYVTEPVTLGGKAIGAGEKVLLLYGSANRDRAVFDDPDAVHIERSPNPHLTFGIGAHHCQGAALARMELRVVLEEVLARLPDYRIVHEDVVHTHSAGTIFERLSLPSVF